MQGPAGEVFCAPGLSLSLMATSPLAPDCHGDCRASLKQPRCEAAAAHPVQAEASRNPPATWVQTLELRRTCTPTGDAPSLSHPQPREIEAGTGGGEQHAVPLLGLVRAHSLPGQATRHHLPGSPRNQAIVLDGSCSSALTQLSTSPRPSPLLCPLLAGQD